MTVRLATFEDIPALVQVGLSFHERTPYKHIKVDRQSITKNFAWAISSAQGIVIVEEKGDQVVGFLLGCIQEFWWSRQRLATDLAFVFENGWNSIRMTKMFIEWARRQPRVAEVTMAVSSGLDPQRMAAIYRRAGMQCMGGLYTSFTAMGDSNVRSIQGHQEGLQESR